MIKGNQIPVEPVYFAGYNYKVIAATTHKILYHFLKIQTSLCTG